MFLLPQRGPKFISLCFRESAWFGLHVASQSDGVYYFGPDCQHLPSPGHLKSTSVVSSTMCGMLNNSSGTDYMSEFFECSKSLPYVCEETQSGLFLHKYLI